jgi:hypothetical protein
MIRALDVRCTDLSGQSSDGQPKIYHLQLLRALEETLPATFERKKAKKLFKHKHIKERKDVYLDANKQKN